MIYLFSSSFYDLFLQNVLNACCYPDGYVIRLRYGAQYVSADLRNNDAWKKLPGQGALFVFAEGALENRNSPQKRDYRFLPIRDCEIQSVQMTAGISIIDIRLGSFVHYGEKSYRTQEESWDKQIKSHADRPYPKDFQSSEGSYVYRGQQLTISRGKEAGAEMAWRSVIDRLNQSELKECVTYQVRGFYRMRTWPLSNRWPERLIKPSISGPDAVYRFRTGETILMKALLYGQANADTSGKSIRVEFDSKAFTSTSVTKIPINSRYDEARVLLPSVRGTDTVVSALTLIPTGDDTKIWAPQPSFVISVGPSRRYLLGVAALFALAFFVANTGRLTDYKFLWDGTLQRDPIGSLNNLTKPIGALLFLAGTWIYLRKFPLK